MVLDKSRNGESRVAMINAKVYFFSMEMYPDSDIIGFMHHDGVRLAVNVPKKSGHMQACMSPEDFGIGL